MNSTGGKRSRIYNQDGVRELRYRNWHRGSGVLRQHVVRFIGGLNYPRIGTVTDNQVYAFFTGTPLHLVEEALDEALRTGEVIGDKAHLSARLRKVA